MKRWHLESIIRTSEPRGRLAIPDWRKPRLMVGRRVGIPVKQQEDGLVRKLVRRALSSD